MPRSGHGAVWQVNTWICVKMTIDTTSYYTQHGVTARAPGTKANLAGC